MSAARRVLIRCFSWFQLHACIDIFGALRAVERKYRHGEVGVSTRKQGFEGAGVLAALD